MPELNNQLNLRHNKFWLVTVVIFATIYSLVSLVNHYNYRTYTYDLGLESNAAYDYAHFRFNDCMLMQPQYENYLSDHFSVDLIFISPFVYLFGSYGLLIAQILILLIGGIGVYRYVLHRSSDVFLANMALIHFYSFWGIFSALGFDFHNNVIGAMAVPWIFYFVSKRNLKWASIAFAWLLLSKENMALWAFGLLAGMAILFRKDFRMRNALLIGSGISIIYFLLVVNVIIPSLANANRHYNHLHYSELGNSLGEIISRLIKTPYIFFKLMYWTSYPEWWLKEIKPDLLMFLFLGGGFALIYKPHFLLMILPILAQKMFNDDPVKWGVGYHYNVEFAPVLAIAVYEFADGYVKKKWGRRLVLFLATGVAMCATFAMTKKNKALYFKYEHVRFYDKEHYKTNFDVKELNKALELVPRDARISVTQQIGAKLALRDYIYMFPNKGDAEYIILLLDDSFYPLSSTEFAIELEKLKQDSTWKIIYDKNHTLIFKKQ